MDNLCLIFDIFKDLETYLNGERHQVEFELITGVAELARLHHYLHDAILLDLSHLSNRFLDESRLLRRQLPLLALISGHFLQHCVRLGHWLAHRSITPILMTHIAALASFCVIYIIMIRH